MNRVNTIRTNVRPIKKLFLIEENDFEKFTTIVRSLTQELAGISNIILVNDKNLLKPSTKAFVDYHDPDVIINYATLNDDKLIKFFKIPSFSASEQNTVSRFSLPFNVVDNLPFPLKIDKASLQHGIHSCINELLDLSRPFDVQKLLHFGSVDTNYAESLEGTLFEELSLSDIESVEHFFQLVDFRKTSFLYNLFDLARIGHGSSVWHLDFNEEKYFEDKPTVIFGSKDNLESMIYFWNTRATHPYNQTVWFPIEMLVGHENLLSDFKYNCSFVEDKSLTNLVAEIGLIDVDASKYYFGGYILEWEIYENIENISIIDSKARIQHPFEKLFSKQGFNINLTLNISGLPELHLPKSMSLGKLFVDLPDDSIFNHYFARTHKLGLSLFCDHFNPLQQAPIVQELKIPDSKTIFSTIFSENLLKLIETNSTSMANEAIEIFGGYEGLSLITNQDIFELIIKLAPKRVEKIVEKLQQKIDFDEDKAQSLRELIVDNPSIFSTINSETVVSIETMASMLPITSKKKGILYPLIQELYDKRILLRGKYFSCPNCNHKLWYPLDAIQEDIKCYGCNKFVQIPIFEGAKVLSDHFKLNELISIAVDQGLLPLMLTANFLYSLPYYSKRLLFDHEIHCLNKDDKIAEIDILFMVGGKLGLSEVKADRGFRNEQTDRLLNVAERINADLLIFSTLKDYSSEEVHHLIQYLQTKNLDIPAFIVTKDVLFKAKIPKFEKYFEVSRETSAFATGPILLQ